jgi:predicted nucleic acid-binding protein
MSSSSTTHCVDANLVVHYAGKQTPDAVEHRWHLWHAERAQLVAPALLWYEVVNTLHQAVRLGLTTADAAAKSLAESWTLPIQLHGDDTLHDRALALASRFTLPAAYDAHYLALAERFGAPLWTTDRRLATAVGDSLPEVRLIES